MKKEIFDAYVGIILQRFYLKEEELFKKDKRRSVSNARFLLYYLCNERNMTLAEIQKFMGEYGYNLYHSTVRHGIKIMSEMVENDIDYKDLVQNIKKTIRIH